MISWDSGAKGDSNGLSRGSSGQLFHSLAHSHLSANINLGVHMANLCPAKL